MMEDTIVREGTFSVHSIAILTLSNIACMSGVCGDAVVLQAGPAHPLAHHGVDPPHTQLAAAQLRLLIFAL